ncbi:MAG: serine/threonine-protein phosphatase [Prevotella sp.]|nr:serine/threonine-protein phosphatase [Prevotella sp.]
MNTNKLMVGVLSFLFPLSIFLLSSCSNKPSQEKRDRAEQLVETAHKSKDYQRLMRLADSLEADGSLTPARAYYWRGYASDRTNRRRMAEFYFNTALKEAGSDDPDVCAKAASHLANIMALRGDYENGLKLATPVVRQLEEQQCDTTSDYVNLLIYIGCCQAGLGTSGEATADGFEKAYGRHLDNVKKNRTDEAYKDAIAGLINITYACNFTGNYRDALKWNDHFSELLNEYEQRPGVSPDYVDKQQARHNLYQAQALEGLGKVDEAAKAFDTFLTTAYAKTPEGRIMANDYLFAAKRWGEAADNYQSLDALLGDGQKTYTLENIQELVLKKYQANILAGRRDTAAAVSMLLCDSLASAFQRAKEVDAAEQAVIVSKVEELGDQQIAANRRLQLEVLGLIGLLFLAVIGYVFYRRHHHYQLHLAHKELRKEYGELEATTTERSRTETEQHIAAAIQQYVAYKPLPQHDDLSLLVSQVPGTMAGGSFCETIRQGDTLLFAIGSATGKGVAAATATAMAWAQFRTVAAITQAPETIVNAISQAIADGNHIPVRLFVGALDLSSGSLQYCNAGNNTPLLSGEELTLLPSDDNQPAGTQVGIAYTAHQTVLDKNQLLFLYTNGVVKATDADGKELGDKHLRGMALQAIKVNARPEPFFQDIRKAISEYTGDVPQTDDQTLMVIARP